MTDLEAKARAIVARWNLADDDALETLITQALADEREACAQEVEAMARHYPTDIFTPPPSGQHGKTVDGCSAAAIRTILPTIAAAIRKGREVT